MSMYELVSLRHRPQLVHSAIHLHAVKEGHSMKAAAASARLIFLFGACAAAPGRITRQRSAAAAADALPAFAPDTAGRVTRSSRRLAS